MGGSAVVGGASDEQGGETSGEQAAEQAGDQLDEATVQRLFGLGGEGFFRELVGDFVTSSNQSSAAIRGVLESPISLRNARAGHCGEVAPPGPALTSAMSDTVAAAAHSLKSASATLGVLELSARCREMETAATQRDEARLRAAFAGFVAVLERAQRALRERAAQRPGSLDA